MSTLKTNNIEHLDASSASIQTTSGGGVIFAGISTFQSDANFDANVNIAGTITYEDVTSVDSVGVITAQSDVVIADKIIHLSDTDTAIRFPAADTFTVETAGAERFRIKDGEVGIGTNNPAQRLSILNGSGDGHLELRGSSNYGILYRRDSDGTLTGYVGSGAGVNLGNDNLAVSASKSDGALIFQTGGTAASDEAARIDSSGRLLVGNTSTTNTGLLCVKGNASSATGEAQLTLQKGTAVSGADQHIGSLNFGEGNANTAIIKAFTNANWTGSSRPTYMTFETTPSSSGSPTERMRIDINGQLGLGTDVPSFAEFGSNTRGAAIQDIGATNTGLLVGHNSNRNYLVAAGNGNFYLSHYGTGNMLFGVSSTGAERMRIENDGTLFLDNITGDAASGSTMKYNNSDKEVRYDTSSRLLKTNITECTYGIETIKKLKPSRFTPQKYDKEGNITVSDESCIGFIADEMVEDVPEVVQMYPKSTLTKNVEDTELVPAAISYDKLTPVLTKALQEAITKIETLEQRLTDAGL